jgi:protein gp37
MSDKSKIEWTQATWNCVTGCSKVSEGCRNCYALRDWARLSANPNTVYHGRKFTDVQCHPERLDQPLRWTKPRRVFVNSMSDLFHESVPDAFIDQVFAVMALAKQHVFQVLTKRPERMRDYLCARNGLGNPEICSAINSIPYGLGNRHGALSMPLPNVWLGVSIEDQATADERIPLLLQTPAAVRWVSAEPLIGPVRLDEPGLHGGPGQLDWCVVGGESGPNARPMHPDWVRSLRDQCQAAGVPFFFKQWGEFYPADQVSSPDQLKAKGDIGTAIRTGSAVDLGDQWTWRIGKKAAGRLLDGRTWDQYPGGSNAAAV